MIDYFRTIFTAQYEASLAMLRQCIAACPEHRWEEKVANGSFRWVVYHTLFFTDFYLSRENAFTLRDLHQIGGDERQDRPAPGLEKPLTLDYVNLVREQVRVSVGEETEASLRDESGFSRHTAITRGELHLYNIRHVQHHAGQLSAHLRRVGIVPPQSNEVRWVGSGWRT